MTSKDAFAEKFQSAILTCFNWPRFVSEDWPIEIVAMNDTRQFEVLRLPWFLSSKNEFVSFEVEDSVPVRLSDVGDWFTYLPMEMRAKIEKFEREFRDARHHVSFDFPSYAIPEHAVFGS